MEHRISVGAFVVENDRLLMVNHRRAGRYDFWVPPGGGVVGTETLEEAAVREVREETGLEVEVGPLLYIEEFWQPSQRAVKFWFAASRTGGKLFFEAEEATREYIVGGAFLSRSECAKRITFPEVARERFWADREKDPQIPAYLGLREMEFF